MFISYQAKAAALIALTGRACRRAAEFWISEARATVPAAWLVRFPLASPTLTLSSRNGIACGTLEGSPVPADFVGPTQEVSTEGIGAWLHSRNLSREEVTIRVTLGAEKFLNRKMLVPAAALGSLKSIILQEIVHRTPFEPSEVFHTARPVADVASGDIIEVEHWIICRDRASAALEAFGLRTEEIDALVVSGSVPPLVVPLREASVEYLQPARRLVQLAAAGAIAISLFGAIALEWAASTETSRLAEAIEHIRRQGASAEPAAQLLALRALPGVVQIWEELSGVLPDHTYLNELRVADGSISISGFSADAAHLIRLLDQSPLFTNAHLTGAITPDNAQYKDHFSLAFQLRRAQRSLQRGTAVARGEP